MTSRELNLKLIEHFPEIKDSFYDETSWQDGDETGSHVVYEDVFVPFIKKEIFQKKERELSTIFNYIEGLLCLDDEYVNEVIALSVIESLLFDEYVDKSYVIQFVGQRTLNMIKEIIESLKE